jgi:hypothetical protein
MIQWLPSYISIDSEEFIIMIDGEERMVNRVKVVQANTPYELYIYSFNRGIARSIEQNKDMALISVPCLLQLFPNAIYKPPLKPQFQNLGESFHSHPRILSPLNL